MSRTRRALVVGASAGIGREIAIHLATLGYSLALVGRRRERLDALGERVGGATLIAADVSDPSVCASVVGEAAAGLGGIDLLVNAASASRLAPLAEATPQQWSETLLTNTVAPALITAAALEHLSTAAVVSVLSSESVADPHLGLVPYAASKAAMETTLQGFRVEHPDVRFCCLRVGATEGTEFARDFDPAVAADLFPRWIESGQIPSRFMHATELGAAIASILDLAVANPGLDVQDLVIRAPGAAHGGDTAAMLDNVQRAASAS